MAFTRIGTSFLKSSGQTSRVITTTVGVSVGNLIVVAVANGNSSAGTVTAVDSAGNTYTQAAQFQRSTVLTTTVLQAVCTSALASGGTITVSWSPATTIAIALEAWKIDDFSSWALDQTNGAGAAAATPISAGSITPTASPSVAMAFCGINAAVGDFVNGAGAGWTVDSGGGIGSTGGSKSSNIAILGETRSLSNTSAISGTFGDLNGTDDYAAVVANWVAGAPPAPSAYIDACVADGAIAIWRFNEASGTTLTHDPAVSSPNGTYSGSGVAHGKPGPIPDDGATATHFASSGSSEAHVTQSLSGLTAVTLEFWLSWDVFENVDVGCIEYTNNYNNSTPPAFAVFPNESGSGRIQFALASGAGANYNTKTVARPSAGDWHHIACVYDLTQAQANQVTPYLDGVAPTTLHPDTALITGTFPSSILYFMSRGGTSQFGNGALANVILYPTALTAVQIAAHYAAANIPTPTRFYMNSGGSPSLGSLSFDGLWDRTTDAVRLPMNTSKQNSSLVTTAKQCGSINANWDVCHYQFQSPSLPVAGTLSGTFKGWFQGIESATGANAYPQVSVRVVSADGTTVRGTAYSGGVQTAASALVEFDNISTYQAQRFPDSRDSTFLTDVSYQANDIIVVEIGVRHLTAGGTTQSATIRQGDATANSDMVETQNGSTLSVPWIEFSQDLFPGATSINASETAAAVAAPTEIDLNRAEVSTTVDTPSLVALLVADSATGVEAAQPPGGIVNVAQAGHGTDAVSTVGPSVSDTGVGAQATSQIAFSIVDQTATGTDGFSVIAISAADVGAGIDNAGQIGVLSAVDTGHAVEGTSVFVVGATQTVSSADTGSGSDRTALVGLALVQAVLATDIGTSNLSDTQVDAGTVLENVSLGLAVSDTGSGIGDTFPVDLGDITPEVNESATAIDSAYVTIVVAESASSADSILYLSPLVAQSAVGVEVVLSLGIGVAQSAIGIERVTGVSQGTAPSVADIAHAIDAAQITVLLNESGHATENLSIPIWGPKASAAVVTPHQFTRAQVIYAGGVSAIPITAGRTTVSLLFVSTQATVLTSHSGRTSLTVIGSSKTLLQTFRPGQLMQLTLTEPVQEQAPLDPVMAVLEKRKAHRERALAIRAQAGLPSSEWTLHRVRRILRPRGNREWRR